MITVSQSRLTTWQHSTEMVVTFWSAILLCASVQGGPNPKVIDLGYELNENTQYWPGVQRFTITDRTREKNENGIPWFAVNTFQSAEHVGTHLDAPFHFIEQGWKVVDIPLDRFFAKGILIDVSGEVEDNNDFELLPKHIEDWEGQHGTIPEGSVVLVRFGWTSRYDDHDVYFGIKNGDETKLNFPGLSEKSVELLITRKVYGVGVDTASLDPGKEVLFKAHQKLLGASIFGLENLNLTHPELPAQGFKLHILPMKITEGTGAPARVIAFLDPPVAATEVKNESVGSNLWKWLTRFFT